MGISRLSARVGSRSSSSVNARSMMPSTDSGEGVVSIAV